MMHLIDITLTPLVRILCFILGGAIAVALIYYIFIGITLKMARKRHRDALGWILLSLFVSPILTWIILLIVGDSK